MDSDFPKNHLEKREQRASPAKETSLLQKKPACRKRKRAGRQALL
jgi:hypothetical protein